MIKIALLIPLCFCTVASMFLSGCTTISSDSTGSIIDLQLDEAAPYSGDIKFSFTYVNDDEDGSLELIVEYKLSGGNWTTARVLDNSGDTATADLVGSHPGNYTFYWDSDGNNVGTLNAAAVFLRVSPGTDEDATSDELDAFVVDNTPSS